MLGSIRHKAIRQFVESGDAKGLPADMVSRLRRLLSALAATDDLELLRSVPGWRLHALRGDLQEYWSMSVTGNWRIVFKWDDGVANDIDLVDYH